MAVGPVSYRVIASRATTSTGASFPEVEKLVANGVVRILDLVFVLRDDNADRVTLEVDQMDELAR